ncbi:hypothetical protein LCGC14_1243470, partial [marine sediment metagenome]
MAVDLLLAKQKLLTAINSMSNEMISDEVLRPSASGNCPLRLWLDRRNPQVEERELKYGWYTFQGKLAEAALLPLLEAAGARILYPPDDKERKEIDEQHGLIGTPHVDGAIKWQEIGLGDWAFLEFKYLRAMASIEIILNGLESSRDYWYQTVSYLMQAEIAVQNSGWGIEPPKQMLFFLAPKDASTVQMLIGGRTKQTKKELETPEKMKPEEL